MRPLLFIISLLPFTNCFSQVVIDTTNERSYKSSLKKISSELQKTISELDSDRKFTGGTVIITEYKIDTLNKSEFKKRELSKITIRDIDPKTNETIENKNTVYKNDNEYSLDICGSKFLKDTLLIEIGNPFLNQTIKHYVYKNHVQTTFNEYYKYDSILKTKDNDALTNDLTIPVRTINFSLSDTAFDIGKTIYGFAEIITDSYYLKDEWDKNQFYKLRRKIKYYFKFTVTKNST